MPFVKSSVGGCSRKIQPILKVKPRDRDTWFYRECDLCLRPVCEQHSTESDGQIVCDRCRREQQPSPQPDLLNLGLEHLGRPADADAPGNDAIPQILEALR